MIDAVKRTFTIIEQLEECNGGTPTELAEDLTLNMGTIEDHLETLTELGYLVTNGTEYSLSAEFISLGEYVKSSTPEYKAAASKVTELAAETGESASFVVESHGVGIWIIGEQGSNTDLPNLLRNKEYLHATAPGKAILANLSAERVDEIIDTHGLPAVGTDTITDRDRLQEELAEVRSEGVAFNRGEDIEGLRAVGVPVMGQNDNVVGALDVYGSAYRLSGKRFEQELPGLMKTAADDIRIAANFERHAGP